MFRDIPDDEAEATVDAAWEHGTRFFDTAPMYGAGLAEIRLGKYLAQHDRDDYVLSTKVGRLVLDEIDTDEHDSEMFKFGLVNRVVYDYTEAGAVKSIEGSLNRLGVDRLDFVFVHDPAQDFHGDAWLAQLETARTGAFRALARLRDEGVIKGWGLGVNLTEPVEFTLGLTDVQPDSTLLAGRYTLLDHEHALQRLMPTAAAQGVDIVIGGPYNSGVLAGGTRFEYQNAPAEITAKVARITDIAHRYDVPHQGRSVAVLARSPRHCRSHLRRQQARTHPRRLRGAAHQDPRRLLARTARPTPRRRQRAAARGQPHKARRAGHHQTPACCAHMTIPVWLTNPIGWELPATTGRGLASPWPSST